VAKFLADYMKTNDLDVEMQEVEPGRLQPIGFLSGRGGNDGLQLQKIRQLSFISAADRPN